MRLRSLALLVAFGVSGLAAECQAQVPFTNVNDPFFAYYSYYLPRQQAQANSPGPEATINAITANRQQFAATNRNDMFDPTAQARDFFGSETGEFSPNSGLRKRTLTGSQVSRLGGNLNGLGPRGAGEEREHQRGPVQGLLGRLRWNGRRDGPPRTSLNPT